MAAVFAAYIIHQALVFHIDNSSTTPALTSSLNTDSIQRRGAVARSRKQEGKKEGATCLTKGKSRVGTHAGVEWVGTGLTANHGPLCGAFKQKQSEGKENIQGCLGKPAAMLFIDTHPSLVRLYKKKIPNKQT